MLKEWELIYRKEGRENLLKGNYMKAYMKKKQHQDIKSKSKDDLIEEVERLRMENAYLKKLNALVQKRLKPNNGKK
jgi:transposase